MTVKDVWQVSPQAYVFLRKIDGETHDNPVPYVGGMKYSGYYVHRIVPTSYPMYKFVLELDVDSTEEALK